MNKITSFFTKQPSGKIAENFKLKYGFLVIFIVFLFGHLLILFNTPEKDPGNYNGIISSILIICGHLAGNFKFGPLLTASLRIVSLLLILFAIYSLFLLVLNF